MKIWGSLPENNFIVPVLHLQIGLGNYAFKNLLCFLNSGAEKLSMGEELYRNTLVTVNQLISKGQKDHQIWGVNDGVMLQTKDMQINHLQTIK